jgi:hypothetical protein
MTKKRFIFSDLIIEELIPTKIYDLGGDACAQHVDILKKCKY